MLNSRYSMWLGWGPELIFFCNDAYREQTLGEKFESVLGRPFHEVWAEIWDVLAPRINHVLSTGEATWDEGLLLFLERNGYPEETYHTFSYSPAPGDGEQEIGGLFCVVFEETDRVISERRIATLGNFASMLAATKTTQELYLVIERCLSAEARDIPFSLTYLFNDDGSATRVAHTGFESDHPAAPLQAVDDSAWPLSALLAGAGPVVLDLDPDERWPTGAWRLPPRRALLIPIAQQGESRPAGVFIAAVNPHRPLDEGVHSFVQLFVGQLAAALSSSLAYEEASRRAEALAELDRAKTAFFSNVSHEFRTPLTLMLAPIEDMRGSRSLLAEDRERLELVHRNSLRLLRLVNMLLDFSRLEAGRVEAVFQETELSEFTADLSSNFRSVTEQAGVKLEVDCQTLGEAIFVDRAMWEKIVLNLLSNAFKFTFEGTISVRVSLADGHAELVVADTGTGIAEAELPRLFERFHRIEGARSRSHEGSGIGLALVSDLVRLHGGEITVESRVGEGSAFRVRIPRGDKHLPQDRVQPKSSVPISATSAPAYVEEALRWLTPGPVQADALQGSAPAGAPGTSRRLLIADDNADMLDYLTRLLGEQWDVEPVRDGQAALEAIRRRPPDLVLSDVMMPTLDGFGLLAALRADPALKAIPVVLLSARAGEEATEEALRAGADDYIVKPFVARDLMVRVAARLAAARAAQDAIAQRQNLYRHFMQAPFPIGIYKGPNHTIELLNDAALKAWQKTRAVIGRPLLDVFPEIRDQPFPQLLDQVFRTGIAYEGQEVLTLLPDGSDGFIEAYFNLVYAPLFNQAGEVEGLLSCGFDTTMSVRARQESNRATREAVVVKERALAQAEQTNRAKDEFLATMSHELRTPLNAMLGWATLLRSDARDLSKVQRGLAIIERNAQTQARLVSDLLDVSRITSGKLSLTLKNVQLSAVVHAAADVVRAAAEAKGVRLVVDLDPDVGTIVGDPDRLQQIIWNLLTNAIRFTPAKGRVTVTGRRFESGLEIKVEDTGAGIAPSHLPHIFERFRQVDSSITRAHSGLGLGLAIVRHLVEAHGGKVSVSSDGAGAGASFTVTLPIHAVHAPALERISETTEPERWGSRPASSTQLGGVRMLIVDDEPDSLDLLRVVLEGAGAEITAVTTARDALAAPGQFDVVLSDIGMPHVDGYTFMQHFRERCSGREVPAIALTAYARFEDAQRALRAGYQEHLTKPVDAAKLVEAVYKWAHTAAVPE